MSETETKSKSVVVQSDLGLHLRAAGAVAQLAGRYQSRIWLQQGTQSADAKSIMSLLTLAAARGTRLEVCAEGPDAAHAIGAVVSLIERGFKV